MSDNLVHSGTAVSWYRCDGKDCPICGTAEPAAVSVIAHEPWLFAIEDSNGNWKDGEACVFGDRVSAQNEVDLLNDDFEGEKEYKVVPLYREGT